MKRCLGYDRISPKIVEWCNEEATLECLYWEDVPSRHWRCEKHRPAEGFFPIVRPAAFEDGE